MSGWHLCHDVHCRTAPEHPCHEPDCRHVGIAPPPGARPPEGDMTLLEALQWAVAVADEALRPYQTVTDMEKQETAYACHGCGGTFLSRWPEWAEPTDVSFPHATDCRYLAARRLARVSADGRDSGAPRGEGA